MPTRSLLSLSSFIFQRPPTKDVDSPSEEKSDGPTLILDHVYLGSQCDAFDPATLTKFGINRVINISDNGPKSDLIPDDGNHFLRIPVKDSYEAKLSPHFDAAFDFIENARKSNENVLIHCLAGISRSPTLVMAYVMRINAMTSDEAYAFVKSRRPSVSPNLNFMGQLFQYEKLLILDGLLPLRKRPRSYAGFDYSAERLLLPPIPQDPSPNRSDKLEKSPSVDLSSLTSMRENFMNENGKRTNNVPLALPDRPRQLMKNCCLRKNVTSRDVNPTLPSPSTEFSKLDISLTNPCFDSPQTSSPMGSKASGTIAAENPMFALNSSSDDESNKMGMTSEPNTSQRISSDRAKSELQQNSSLWKCLLPKAARRVQHKRPKSSFIIIRQPKCCQLPSRTPLSLLPVVVDVKEESATSPIPTDNSQSEHKEPEVNPDVQKDEKKFEADEVSSSSSVEIAVQ